jgi:tetratricopeptide (TPR) repeat protein
LLALSFYSAGNYREALPLLEKLGPRLPKNSPDSSYLISICYVMTQQWDSARKVLAQMFYVAPDSAMAYLTLGKLLVRQQMVEVAVTQIETALRLEPRLAMAHFLLGEIDLYHSNAQGAVTEFQKELAVNPTVWLVYWRLGDAYMRLANYDEAEKVLKKAIWLNEASPGAFILLGEIALKKNDPALASGFLERALAIDPQNFDAHYALATAYKALGREKDANQHFEISKTLRNKKHNSDKNTLPPVCGSGSRGKYARRVLLLAHGLAPSRLAAAGENGLRRQEALCGLHARPTPRAHDELRQDRHLVVRHAGSPRRAGLAVRGNERHGSPASARHPGEQSQPVAR